MTILNPTAQRDAKRAELDDALAAAREEFTEAQESHRAAKERLSSIRSTLTRTSAEVTYRTGSRGASFDVKAAALAQVALGRATLDDARSVGAGSMSEMSLSELQSSATGLTAELQDAELELRFAASRVRVTGSKVIEALSALSALRYDVAAEELLDAWHELRLLSIELESRAWPAVPVSHSNWSNMKLPRHYSMKVGPVDPFEQYVDLNGAMRTGRLSATSERLHKIFNELR
jgi:hypothetical protein